MHLEAVEVGEHHVEHDQVGPERLRPSARAPRPVGAACDVEALVAQGGARPASVMLGLVVDDEDPGGRLLRHGPSLAWPAVNRL